MNDVNISPNDEQVLGFQFPCEFTIKIIGDNREDYREIVVAILESHVAELNPDLITSRPSSGGKYLSLSSTFIAENREQLDNLYRDLSAHPNIHWVW
jgi:uncharacterized protein